MKYDKSYLRRNSILQRKKRYLTVKKFNFDLIFKLIKKHFHKKKITIAGYYPSNYEVNILKFLKKASQNKFKIALPVKRPSGKMSFKSWIFNEPLYVSTFGTLEPLNTNKEKLKIINEIWELFQKGKLNLPTLGKTFSLEQFQEALIESQKPQKKGKITIRMS